MGIPVGTGAPGTGRSANVKSTFIFADSTPARPRGLPVVPSGAGCIGRYTISTRIQETGVSAIEIAALAALIFVAATIYSSVGHAGASGYLAAMALFGLPPAVMRPTALTLNVIVASLATLRLRRANLVRWRPLVPLCATSIPAAFAGGMIQLPGHWYRTLVGIVLLAAAWRLFFDPRDATRQEAADTTRIPWGPAAVTGLLVGLLSGLTGTGGGIFLSPLL